MDASSLSAGMMTATESNGLMVFASNLSDCPIPATALKQSAEPSSTAR
jgi:hypothetical protein